MAAGEEEEGEVPDVPVRNGRGREHQGREAETREEKRRAGGGLHRAPDVEVLAVNFSPEPEKESEQELESGAELN